MSFVNCHSSSKVLVDVTHVCSALAFDSLPLDRSFYMSREVDARFGLIYFRRIGYHGESTDTSIEASRRG